VRARLFSLFLLCILVFGIGSYFPFLKIQQWSIKRDAFRRIEMGILQQNLKTVLLSPENSSRIHWEKENVEFEFEGKMYDVVSIDTLNGMVRYTCLNDVEEDDLFSRFTELIHEEKVNGKTTSKESTNSFPETIGALVYLPGYKINFSGPVATAAVRYDHKTAYSFEYVTEISRPPSI
jgi:hypothetical protein